MNQNHVETDVDRVLTSYFQSEMPKPWPEWQAPAANGPRRRSRWLGLTRFAVAASLAGLLAAYLALAGFFPREAPGKFHDDPSRHIGQNPKAPAVNR